MPRDGSNIYHRPPGTDGIPDTTIESARYNVFVADVEQDLNTPRPIIAGGTGATSSTAAMTSLGGEIANQVVTNYDTFPFQAGSFSSAPGATSAPDASHAFAGTCINTTTASDIVLQAYALSSATTGVTYIREKNGGTWSAWVTMASPNDGVNKVSKAGDTMSGALTINSTLNVTGNITAPTFISNGTNYIFSDGTNLIARTNGAFYVQNTGGASQAINASALNVGSGSISSGAINCSTVTSSGDINGHDLHANRGDGTGALFFGPSNYLYWDNSKFNLTNSLNVGGTLTASGDAHLNGGTTYANAITCSSLNCSGALSVGSFTANPIYVGSGATYMVSDGTNLIARTSGWFYVQNPSGGPMGIQCNVVVAADYITAGTYISAYGDMSANGNFHAGGEVDAAGHTCKQGYGAAPNGHHFNIAWPDDGYSYLWIDYFNAGILTTPSDYRIKKDVVDLPGMWEIVKALRPIKYSHTDFTPPARKDGATQLPLFVDSDIERWGFIAHELQETLTPSAATGVKDSPDTIQSPNPFTVIAALTKALQEAMVRIEKLEGAARKR